MQIKRLRLIDGYGLVIFALALATLSGCSVIETASPDNVVQHPFGTESIKIGMTKNEVESLWGKPDEISVVEDKEKWKGSREVWTYRASYTVVPVDAGYLSKTKKLYFDGNNLTNIGE